MKNPKGLKKKIGGKVDRPNKLKTPKGAVKRLKRKTPEQR